ncbi:MAG: DUF4492 domain-containing protein [Alloprevotella sp.]|nr:DUF4492 domain-containing protein [Bacteroidales bacterium]MDY3943021.1 DUF4492 domain-containing protein [Alloprevotella sp.]
MNTPITTLKRIFRFYVDGFRGMTWGRTMWTIIIIKLIVMFGVLKVFFFKSALAGQTTEQKQETVSRNLTRPIAP